MQWTTGIQHSLRVTAALGYTNQRQEKHSDGPECILLLDLVCCVIALP